MTVRVRELREKLRALRDYGRDHPSRKELLAALLITSDSTLRYYESGSATRDPGRVPEDTFERLVEIFTTQLPGERSRDEVLALLDGPAETMRSAFVSGSSMRWWRLVETAARRAGARLIRFEAFDIGLVEVLEPPGVDPPREDTVLLNEPFALSFAATPGAYNLVLQCAQRAWAGVPFASGDFIYKASGQEIEIPGADDLHRPRWLVETCDTGRHRFVCLSSRADFPVAAIDAVTQGVLDRVDLDRIAGFYEEQPSGGKSLSVFDLLVAANAAGRVAPRAGRRGARTT